MKYINYLIAAAILSFLLAKPAGAVDTDNTIDESNAQVEIHIAEDYIDFTDPNCAFSEAEQKCLTFEEFEQKLGRGGVVLIGGFGGGLFGAGAAWASGGNAASIAAGWAFGFAGGALGAGIAAAPGLIANGTVRVLLGTSIAGVYQVAGGGMSNTILVCKGPCPRVPTRRSPKRSTGY